MFVYMFACIVYAYVFVCLVWFLHFRFRVAVLRGKTQRTPWTHVANKCKQQCNVHTKQMQNCRTQMQKDMGATMQPQMQTTQYTTLHFPFTLEAFLHFLLFFENRALCRFCTLQFHLEQREACRKISLGRYGMRRCLFIAWFLLRGISLLSAN